MYPGFIWNSVIRYSFCRDRSDDSPVTLRKMLNQLIEIALIRSGLLSWYNNDRFGHWFMVQILAKIFFFFTQLKN